MIVTLIRTLIIFITLIVIMRLMGKRQIGEMQPFEFVVTLIVADLACIPMADVSIPLVYGVVAILGLFLLHEIMSLLEHKGNFMKFIISGKPSIVINKDGVCLSELKKNDMDVGDLLESMRSMGYFNFDDLDYAIFESNGKLSALESDKDKPEKTGMPLLIINDGKADKSNLEILSLTEKRLSELLAFQNAKIKNTEVMTVDENGRTYIKERNKKYKILTLPVKEQAV